MYVKPHTMKFILYTCLALVYILVLLAINKEGLVVQRGWPTSPTPILSHMEVWLQKYEKPPVARV